MKDSGQASDSVKQPTDRPFLLHPSPPAQHRESELPTAAYVHIPFCRRRCYYCDFAVSVVGDRPPITAAATRSQPPEFGAIAQYVEVLRQEILSTPPVQQPLETVFLGGGTPSLLTVAQLEQILQTLQHQFGIAAAAEISMEIDPDTFDEQRLRGYKAAGINRVSLGVQSFQADLLAACGRTHTPADIHRAVALIRQVDLPNFSLDLISGLPTQTLAQWQASLEAAIALEPPHISVYDLTIEPMTAFGRWYQPGMAPLPTEETTAQMYRLAQQTLTAAGYEHYEVSNYAKPGYQCRHNRVYWKNLPYLGFGMGAASYVHHQRFTRPRKRRDYFQWVQSSKATEGKIECSITSPTERLLDTLMLGFRLAEGLSLTELVQQFGMAAVEKMWRCLMPWRQKGWVEIWDDQTKMTNSPQAELADLPETARMRLSDPEGFLFSNLVLSDLFEAFDEEERSP